MGGVNLLKISTIVFLWATLAYALDEVAVDLNTGDHRADEVIGKSPVELIRLRGFKAEKHFAPTKDGYSINVVRIVNQKIKSRNLKRPVIFNHGLLESSTIWLINSKGVEPLDYEIDCKNSINQLASNKTQFLNGPMMLANNGYDVWLMSMRGTDWSLRHKSLTPVDAQFWNYCLDDFALVDVPAVIDYVRLKTSALKVGYIGHSQATFSVFGLLATRPNYAEVIEPVVAVAPVAFFDHITSLARVLFIATLQGTDRDKHGPFPNNARKMRKLLSSFCTRGLKSLTTQACRLVQLLIGGVGKKWPLGYFSQLPFYTSLKVLRHFGQLIKNKRFMMYDYGSKENKKIYGTSESPSYPIENITSKSLCLISTTKDALSPPEDVQHFKQKLTVPLFKDITIEGAFNHFDLITDEEANKLVFKPILEIFESFEVQSCVNVAASEADEANTNEIENQIAEDISLNADKAEEEANKQESELKL